MSKNPLVNCILEYNKDKIEKKVIDLIMNDEEIRQTFVKNGKAFLEDKLQEDLDPTTNVDYMIDTLLNSASFKGAVLGRGRITTIAKEIPVDMPVEEIKKAGEATLKAIREKPVPEVETIHTKIITTNPVIIKPMTVDKETMKEYHTFLRSISLLFKAKGIVPLKKVDLVQLIDDEKFADSVIDYAIAKRAMVKSGDVYRSTPTMIDKEMARVERELEG